MATAAANLLFQTNPFKWKPNRLRPLGPLQPVKLIISSAIATPKSRFSLQYHPPPTAKKLQSSNSSTSDPKSNSVWKFAVKVTAGVVLGALLLMHRPKTLGRVVATCNPLDRAQKDDPECADRYRSAQWYNLLRTFCETAGLSLYPCAAYYGSLPVLYILSEYLTLTDPSNKLHWSKHWYAWYKRQANFLLIFLLIAHITWAWRHIPSTVVRLNIQVNLSNAGRALHTDLNRIAETTADTSIYKGVNSILTETATTFLKHPDCFISASTYAAGQSHWDDDARNFLNELCLEERIRLGGHPLINVNKNLKVESSTSQKSAHEIQHEHIDVDANQLDKHNKYDLSHLVHTPLMASKKIDLTQESSTSQISATETQDEYMEVIILAAIASKRDDEFPRIIKSWDDLKEALQLLTSEGIYPYVVEVLWKPMSSSSTGRRRLWFR
ncbi:PREDICTED: uncharacterized protein LOC101303467 [Fragaria vesca subsp. vesca]|uniref:uncharacterized protein LOC101303467 n=1 Tax=Fragaria vesca subsp. vesca TaxID=101020 RepID=UPI0002C32AA1|nr:PREDICTED: uncharacterized protein LOC101303467 [Fragaria vesca subsp. vesca]